MDFLALLLADFLAVLSWLRFLLLRTRMSRSFALSQSEVSELDLLHRASSHESQGLSLDQSITRGLLMNAILEEDSFS